MWLRLLRWWYAKMTLTLRLPVGPRGRRTSYWLSTPLHAPRVLACSCPPPSSSPHPLPMPNFRSPTILLMGIAGSSRSRWAIPTCLSTSVHYQSYCSMSSRIYVSVYALLPRIPTSNCLFVCLSVASTISRQTVSLERLSLEPVYWCGISVVFVYIPLEYKRINTRYSHKQLSTVSRYSYDSESN